MADRSILTIRSKNIGLGERLTALGVLSAMKSLRILGSRLKKAKKRAKKNTKKEGRASIRILFVASRGGFPPILAALGVLGSLAGGAAGIAKAVSDLKTNKAALAELKRHDLVMEGRGLYLKPYKDTEIQIEEKKMPLVEEEMNGILRICSSRERPRVYCS